MKNRKWLLVLVSASAIARADVVFAATVTVSALKDAMIFGTSAGADTGNASGKGPALFAGADGTSSRKRSMIAFDLASAGIPTGATIDSVTMTLYLAQVAGSGGGSGGGGAYPNRTVRVYAIQQDWSEGSSGSPTTTGLTGAGAGYPKVAGDATWDYATYNPADLAAGTWNSAGTALHGGNFAATASAAPTFTNFLTLNVPFTWSSSQMTADVQGWVSGTTSNYGWLLKSDLETSPTSFLGFWSKDGASANSNPAIAPSLSVTYSVPEPAGVCLSGIGIAVWAFMRSGRRAKRTRCLCHA